MVSSHFVVTWNLLPQTCHIWMTMVGKLRSVSPYASLSTRKEEENGNNSNLKVYLYYWFFFNFQHVCKWNFKIWQSCYIKYKPCNDRQRKWHIQNCVELKGAVIKHFALKINLQELQCHELIFVVLCNLQ